MGQLNPTRAIATMLVATTVIVIGDTAAKLLIAQGQSAVFVAWMRFAIAAILLLPFSGLRWSELRLLSDWRIWLRAALIVGAISAILTALKTEPLANAFGGFFIGPILAYFLSALVLKERISLARTLLLSFSFVGVLLVVRPGYGMSSGLAFAVLSGLFHGSFLMMTKLLSNQYRPRFLLISQLVIGAILLAPVGLANVPVIGMDATILILISALASAAGNYAILRVNRTTPASLVAPMVYFQLPAAAAIGWFVFADWPDFVSFAGLLMIVTAGFSSFWFAGREKPRPIVRA